MSSLSSLPHSRTPIAKHPFGAPTHTVPPRRPWAVTVIAWLLVLEMAGLLFLAYLNFGQPVSAALLALSVLALGAAVGFARLRRGGWVNAVLVQGGLLLVALLLFSGPRPAYCYGMMLSGILMVLYLHQADVQAAFRQAPGPEPGPP